MNKRYKVVLYNKNLYKEIELTSEKTEITVGTGIEADVRLHKKYFFGTVEIQFTYYNDIWHMTCSENIYFSLGDTRKLLAVSLKHGDTVLLKYDESNNEVFSILFMIDFEYENKDYSCEIDLGNKARLQINNTPNADIQINDSYFTKGSVLLEKKDRNKWVVTDANTLYGVYVNGVKIEQQTELKEHDFFAVNAYSFYLKNEKLYTTKDIKINDETLKYKILIETTTDLNYPKFNRNTRVQYVIPEKEIEIQNPKSKPNEPKKNLLFSLIPSIVMLAMTVVLRGILGNGGTFVIYSVVSMSIGIIMSVVTYMQEGKQYKVACEERERAYQEYIHEKKENIEKLRSEELRALELIYESLEKNIEEAEHFGRRLFERTKMDKDFLQVYVGNGEIEAANQIKYKQQEFVDNDDKLSSIPEQLYKEYRFIKDAPIIADFYKSGAIGIVGKQEKLFSFLKNITLDLTIRHFYGDVKFVYLFHENEVEKMQWISWLQNVYNEKLDIKNIICDEESKNIILEYLYSELSVREQAAGTENMVYENHYIIFVTDVEGINRHPVSKYIEQCNKYGFTFVFLEEYEERLPLGCGEIIRLGADGINQLLKTENGDVISKFQYKEFSDKIAKEIAVKLASVYVDEVNLEGELTKNITLYEMFGIISVEDLNLEERWKQSLVYKSLAAPLGVKNKNQIVSLDISDKSNAHGPHGLVAGTTGSGKSEILQTYILSMATLYHPYEVGFVIIDFKGGGMSNQFTELPHLIGTITNIDGREINRSLLSIKAELVKRQEMFSSAGVNHINDYIKLYKAGKVEKPMPHLIMIVDEFAELKAEYPDFMKELISTARIGRTLGVHLILATQKPSGVVDAQIWSNSKFKLCLKVQTREDSNEVLKTPLAAEIVEPGRAYFQVGNNEIFELFQSAYSGADVPVADEVKDEVFNIYEKNLWGKKKLVYTNKKKKVKGESVSQLRAIVDYVADYCKVQNIERLPGICLPALEDKISTDSLSYDANPQEGICVPFGIYDDPEQQKQGNVMADFSKDNFYIVASAQMGKTVLLQTIAYGLIHKYTPKQVNIYMIDCGSMVLKIFENSKHVGGVVLASEDEKCKNLFKMLNSIILERKKILSEKGIGNYAAYIEAGYEDLPLIVVMIDNMAAFKEYFTQQADELGSLSREAQGVGLSFVITAANVNAMSGRVQANFGKKYALNCNESSEYSNLFGYCKMTPKEVQGRGLMLLERRIVEWQAGIFGTTNKEAERSEELKQFIEEKNNNTQDCAKEIPMVPQKLEIKECMQNKKELFRNAGQLPIGMSYTSIEYTSINMYENNMLALIGNSEQTGRFINVFMYALANNIVFHNVEAFIIDDKAKHLEILNQYGFVRQYTADAAEAFMMLDDFYAEVQMREEEEKEESLILLIIHNANFMSQLYADKNASKELVNRVKTLSEKKAFLIFSQIENQAVGFNASDILKMIKEEKKAVLFAPIHENKMFEVSGRVKADTNFEKSNACYFMDGKYDKIKVFE